MSAALLVGSVAQDLVNLFSVGATYALLALGLAIVFSILRVVNFAYGELVTVPAYVLYLVAGPFALQVPAALLAGVIAALVMERLVFRPLRSASFVTVLFATFAVSVIIQNLIGSVISARHRSVDLPGFLDGFATIGGVTVSTLQIYAAIVCTLALVALSLFLRSTITGLSIRAAAQDFDVTRMMGVRADRVIAVAFAISGLLAAIAAIFITARTGTIEPTMGFTPLLKAFIAIVIGGLGSLSGAVFGGFVLAAIEVGLQTGLPDVALAYRDAVALLIVIVVLYFKPRGLLGRAEA